jgi:hypothetical protein
MPRNTKYGSLTWETNVNQERIERCYGFKILRVGLKNPGLKNGSELVKNSWSID